jgi:hypothetical protein
MEHATANVQHAVSQHATYRYDGGEASVSDRLNRFKNNRQRVVDDAADTNAFKR